MGADRPSRYDSQAEDICDFREMMDLPCGGCIYNGYKQCPRSGGVGLQYERGAAMSAGTASSAVRNYYRSGHLERQLYDC